MSDSVSVQDVRAAAERIRSHLLRTPVVSVPELDEQLGAHVSLKCENLQRGGAFKLRGATNAVLSLGHAELEHGVATESSGNHALAISFAARLAGVPAYIAMPRTARRPKVAAVERFGGKISFCEPNEASRKETVGRLIDETGAVLIHPFENPSVIAGQGTVALELIEQADDLDTVVVPLGGGGLVSGCATVLKALRPGVRVIGVEPAGADDAVRSVAAGERVRLERPQSIADGLLTTVGERPFSIIRRLVDDVVRVEDSDIVLAMRLLWEHAHVMVEPSGAVGIAALMSGAARGQKVGVVLSGGNVECPWVFSDGVLRAQ